VAPFVDNLAVKLVVKSSTKPVVKFLDPIAVPPVLSPEWPTKCQPR